MLIRKLKGLIAVAAIAALTSIGATSAEATTIKVETIYLSSGNDCSGLFGKPFDTCVDPDGSPVLAKTNGSGDVIEINSSFTNITADMFKVTFDDASMSSGTWSYDPCGTCKVVTSWVAKAGNGFLWFHTDPKTAVYSGDWYTPDGKGLSHLTFYDTAVAPVPVPASLPLLLGALGAGAFLRRSKKKRA
ncbi:PEP-CTERM sorting domain-containing protein [Arenibacterium sp. CAU 1754]